MWVDEGLWLIATEGIIKAKKYGMYSGLSARGLSGGEAEGAHQVGNFHLWLLLANSAISFSTWRNDDTYYPMANITTSVAHSILAGAKERETAKLWVGDGGTGRSALQPTQKGETSKDNDKNTMTKTSKDNDKDKKTTMTMKRSNEQLRSLLLRWFSFPRPPSNPWAKGVFPSLAVAPASAPTGTGSSSCSSSCSLSSCSPSTPTSPATSGLDQKRASTGCSTSSTPACQTVWKERRKMLKVVKMRKMLRKGWRRRRLVLWALPVIFPQEFSKIKTVQSKYWHKERTLCSGQKHPEARYHELRFSQEIVFGPWLPLSLLFLLL